MYKWWLLLAVVKGSATHTASSPGHVATLCRCPGARGASLSNAVQQAANGKDRTVPLICARIISIVFTPP